MTKHRNDGKVSLFGFRYRCIGVHEGRSEQLGLRRFESVSNDRGRIRCETRRSLLQRVNPEALKWLEHGKKKAGKERMG